MEIGNQIKMLRQRRGITQEALAEQLGVSPQAVSKWEREAAAPDIGLLPEISAFFGVTIDQLFALSDETRVERIQNMLWDTRVLSPADVEPAREFLLEKARREPENGRPHELLADMENHLAEQHRALAAEYAKEALTRDPKLREAFSELAQAMNGKSPDWNCSNHHRLIDYLKEYIQRNPTCLRAYLWLLDQLLDDFRFDEAGDYCQRMEGLDAGYRSAMYRGAIAWYSGHRREAEAIWKQMQADYPGEWRVAFDLGNFMARGQEYEKAKAFYRRAFAQMEAPRFVDPLESIAQICEIQGDYAGAVAVLTEELDIFEKEWHFATGETADVVRREIARLRERIGT